MRRRLLVFVVLFVATVGILSSVTVAPAPDVAEAAPADRNPRAQPPPRHQVADEVDLTTVVPALEEAFGDRYGGFWIEPARNRDRMHVAVVDATPDDAAVVAQITGRHRQVVTDPVAFGYDELRAAQDEIARTLPRDTGNFTVATDVTTNSVVIETAAADPAAVVAPAQDAARRGAAEQQAADEAAGAAPPAPAERAAPTPEATTEAAPPADAAPAPAPAPEATTEAAPPAEAAPAPERDVAEAVVVESDPTIAVQTTADRTSWWAYESGLSVTTASTWGWHACTSGFFFFHPYFGYFGSTAGHCGALGAYVAVGNTWVDAIRLNRYDGVGWVDADVGLYSLSAWNFPAHPVIRANWPTGLDEKFRNAQIGRGLYLCFEGLASDSDNCGTVVRSNEWLCCDGRGYSFFYSCINYPSGPGDSGGPVYHRYPSNLSVAAGMVSSSVVIGGQRLMCFTMVESMQWQTGMDVVTW